MFSGQEEVTVLHGDHFLLLFHKQLFLKADMLTNFLNDTYEANVLYITYTTKVHGVRATGADMSHNLFQIWMTGWLFAPCAHSQSPLSDVRWDLPNSSKRPIVLQQRSETDMGQDITDLCSDLFVDTFYAKNTLYAPNSTISIEKWWV